MHCEVQSETFPLNFSAFSALKALLKTICHSPRNSLNSPRNSLRNSLNWFSAIQDMPIHTKHSFIRSAGCHHAEHIPCKITSSWKLPSVVKQPLENVATLFLPQAVCSIEFLAHVAFTCIGSTFSCPHKQFLIPRAPAYIALRVTAPTLPMRVPATRPAQEYNRCSPTTIAGCATHEKTIFSAETFYFSCLTRFLCFWRPSAQFKHSLKAEFTPILSAYLRELKALGLLWRNLPAMLCFHNFAMIHTCTHQHSKFQQQVDCFTLRRQHCEVLNVDMCNV